MKQFDDGEVAVAFAPDDNLIVIAAFRQEGFEPCSKFTYRKAMAYLEETDGIESAPSFSAWLDIEK